MAAPEKESITPESALRIARIAGLDVDEARAAELAPQIQALRDGIDAMDAVDLNGVEPALTFILRPE